MVVVARGGGLQDSDGTAAPQQHQQGPAVGPSSPGAAQSAGAAGQVLISPSPQQQRTQWDFHLLITGALLEKGKYKFNRIHLVFCFFYFYHALADTGFVNNIQRTYH